MNTEELFCIRGVSSNLKTVFAQKRIEYAFDETELIGQGTVELLGQACIFSLAIDPTEFIVSISLQFPVTFPKNDYADAALALCMLNDSLLAGSFDFHDGQVSYRIATCFRDSKISIAALKDMVQLCLDAGEIYMTPLIRLQKKDISVERFQKYPF